MQLNNVNSVSSPHSHSFLFKSTLLTSIYDTSTSNSVSNFLSSSLSNSTPYDENVPPLERGDMTKGTHEVFCTWCTTFIKHGQDRHTTNALHHHRGSQKCRPKLINAFIVVCSHITYKSSYWIQSAYYPASMLMTSTHKWIIHRHTHSPLMQVMRHIALASHFSGACALHNQLIH